MTHCKRPIARGRRLRAGRGGKCERNHEAAVCTFMSRLLLVWHACTAAWNWKPCTAAAQLCCARRGGSHPLKRCKRVLPQKPQGYIKSVTNRVCASLVCPSFCGLETAASAEIAPALAAMALAITSRVTQRTVVRTALSSRATDIVRFYHGDQVPQAGNYYDYYVVSEGVAALQAPKHSRSNAQDKPKHRSNAEKLIKETPPIEVAGNMAICDGGESPRGYTCCVMSKSAFESQVAARTGTLLSGFRLTHALGAFLQHASIVVCASSRRRATLRLQLN